MAQQNNPPSNMDPDLTNLQSQMRDLGGRSLPALRQIQANLIETSQAVTANLAGLQLEAERAALNLKTLTKAADDHKNKKSKEYKELRRQAGEQQRAYTVASGLAKSTAIASKAYHTDIEKVAAAAEKKSTETEKSFTSQQGTIALKGIAGGLQGKDGGVLGEMLSAAMGKAATGSLMGASVVATQAVGGLYAVLKLVSQMFATSTRNTASFVESFGASGGLYIAAQNKFKEAAGGAMTMRYSLADAEKVASVAMKDGALNNYAAANLLKRGGAGAETASKDMAEILGKVSVSMLLAGKAMGMTEEESGKMLGSVATMGAFSEATGSAKSHTEKLNLAMAGFVRGNQLSGLGITRMSALTGSFAATMLPLGASFKEVQAQTLGTVGALSALIKNEKAGIATYLNTAEAFKKFTESLLSVGKGIAAPTMAGYQIMAGQSSGDAIKDISTAISATPMERISASIKNIMGLTTSNDLRTVMMAQRLPEETTAVLSRMMKGDPVGFKKFLGAMASKDTRALEALAKEKGMEDYEQIAKALSLGRPPIEQLVTLTQNIFTTLSGLAMGVMTWIGAPIPDKMAALALGGTSARARSSGHSAQSILQR